MCQTLHLMYKYYENDNHALHKTMQKWKELSVISAFLDLNSKSLSFSKDDNLVKLTERD